MSNISAPRGFKPPANVGSRNDGGGPGSGNSYAMFGQQEELENYWDDYYESSDQGNPFRKLTYIPMAIYMLKSAMKNINLLAATAHYKKAKNALTAEAIDGIEGQCPSEDSQG